MFVIVLILPLLSASLLVLFGSYIGTFGSLIISCINLFLAFCFSVILFLTQSYDFLFFVNLWD